MCINISARTGCHCPRWPLGKQTWRQGQETSPHILCLLDMCDKFVKEKHCEKHFKTRPPPIPNLPRQTFTHLLPLLWQLYRDLLLYVITVIFSRYNCSILKSLLLLGRGGGLFLQSSRSQTAKPRHRRRRDVITARGYKSQTAAIRS